LKGPIDAPKRSIDVAALSSWLALRAVEQQSKKLDVLEGREPPAAPAPSSTPGAAPGRNEGAALTVPLPEATGTNSSAAKPTLTDDASPTRPARTPIVPKPKSEPKPAVSAADQLQPLPPPVDIRPAPTPRPPRPAAARQPPKPPTPPAPRSLSEILFGH
jgi:large subunit ribosomal protein L24